MTAMINDLADRVRDVLGRNFQVSRFESSKEVPGRIVLQVVSPDFDGLDDVERQVRVWEILRDSFGDEELLALEYVFTESEEEFGVRNRQANLRAN